MKTLFNIHPTKAIYNIPLKYDKILGKELIFYSQGNTFSYMYVNLVSRRSLVYGLFIRK